MKIRSLTLTLSALALAAASFTASADVLFSNLGTSAPPATVGSHAVTPFDQAAQAAIPLFSDVSVIPGGPNGATVGISPASNKRSIGNGWATWSHGYTGAVYYNNGANQVTLTLPTGTTAFYFYVESNAFGIFDFTATTNAGSESGAIAVNGNAGANGFAFYSTEGESISSITVTVHETSGFAIGEFGISGGATCASEGYTGMKLEWCKNVCERGYTGTLLKIWIQRWMDRYHDLPYCAREGGNPPQGQPQK